MRMKQRQLQLLEAAMSSNSGHTKPAKATSVGQSSTRAVLNAPSVDDDSNSIESDWSVRTPIHHPNVGALLRPAGGDRTRHNYTFPSGEDNPQGFWNTEVSPSSLTAAALATQRCDNVLTWLEVLKDATASPSKADSQTSQAASTSLQELLQASPEIAEVFMERHGCVPLLGLLESWIHQWTRESQASQNLIPSLFDPVARKSNSKGLGWRASMTGPDVRSQMAEKNREKKKILSTNALRIIGLFLEASSTAREQLCLFGVIPQVYVLKITVIPLRVPHQIYISPANS
jgi:hypothetical protein